MPRDIEGTPRHNSCVTMERCVDPSGCGARDTVTTDPHTPNKQEKTTAEQLNSSAAVNTCTHAHPGPFKWLITHGDSERASLTMRSVTCTDLLYHSHYHFKVRHILHLHGCHLVFLGCFTYECTTACVKTEMGTEMGGGGLSGWGPLNWLPAHTNARVW